jgi:hypothetical protein
MYAIPAAVPMVVRTSAAVAARDGLIHACSRARVSKSAFRRERAEATGNQR